MRKNPPLKPSSLKSLSINRIIPNIITLISLCAGMTAIRYAAQGNFEAAAIAIVIATFLDAFDGPTARLLKGTTKMGAELDSLADFISFGVAPALVLYFWALHDLKGIGWGLCLLFCIASALRLARFNIMLDHKVKDQKASFTHTGVPAPAAAGLSLIPMFISFEFSSSFASEPYFVALFLVTISLLMITKIPTFSFKNKHVPKIFVLPLILFIMIYIGMLFHEPWLTLITMGLVYIVVLIPLTLIQSKNKS